MKLLSDSDRASIETALEILRLEAEAQQSIHGIYARIAAEAEVKVNEALDKMKPLRKLLNPKEETG